MKKKNKIIIGILLIILSIFLVYKFGEAFAPGSYPHAEVYKINASEENVINAIKQFKTSHSEFIVPNMTIHKSGSFNLAESEGRKENSYWYLNYFYDKEENQILLIWTRPAENNKTDLALVSINQGLDLGNWKEVNKDFGDPENERIKTKFERSILLPIKHLLN
jgi:uncharacterized membrane protein